jgi:D-3-phosphoglycerate dehydrogenase
LKILHLEYDKYPKDAMNTLEKLYAVSPVVVNSQNELYSVLEANQYEVIICRLGLNIDSKCLKLQPNLKFIVSATTGLNHIDCELALNKGIKIISLKGEDKFLSNIKSTAEHTWAILLALIRNIKPAIKSVENGEWTRTPFLCEELNNHTIGIIGFGRLGKIVAKYAEAFGMRVLVNDIKCIESELLGSAQMVSVEYLLKNADYVLLMISWSKDYEGFMDESKFAMMKKDSYFINTSRGELVDEHALLSNLASEKIKGVGLDVLTNDSSWDGELKGSLELLNYAKMNSNLIITPHIGGYGKHSIASTRGFVIQKLLSIINKEY